MIKGDPRIRSTTAFRGKSPGSVQSRHNFIKSW